MHSKSIINIRNKYGSNISETQQQQFIAEGFCFSTRKVLTIPAGESNIYFNPLAVTNKEVIILSPRFLSIGGEKVILTLYVGATYGAGGTVINGTNRNNNSDNVAQCFFNFNATLSTPGVAAPVEWLIPSTALGVNVVGASTSTILPFIINNNFIQRIKINNTDASTQTFEFDLSWFEIPESETI